MSFLSEDLRQKILAYIPRYPRKQAVTLPVLHLVQDALRCVPLEAVREIAELLDLSPAEVHDTMSFYGIFRDEQHKLGKTRLWVCRGLACELRHEPSIPALRAATCRNPPREVIDDQSGHAMDQGNTFSQQGDLGSFAQQRTGEGQKAHRLAAKPRLRIFDIALTCFTRTACFRIALTRKAALRSLSGVSDSCPARRPPTSTTACAN